MADVHAHHRRHAAGNGSVPGSLSRRDESPECHRLRHSSFVLRAAPLVSRRPGLAGRLKDTIKVEMNPREPDRRKLRWLIITFFCYFLLMVYALPRASVLPYQIFALFGLLNFAILGFFVFGIRKVYLRMKGLTLSEGFEVDETTAKLRLHFDTTRLNDLKICPWKVLGRFHRMSRCRRTAVG